MSETRMGQRAGSEVEGRPGQRLRSLAIHTVLGEDAFALHRIRGVERLGRLPRYEVELVSRDAGITGPMVLGTDATVRLSPVGMAERRWSACFSRFERVGVDPRFRLARYRATLVAWPWFLGLSKDSRIFQNRTSLEIIKEVCAAHGRAGAIAERLVESERYPKRRFCVQYQETAADFVQRLLEDEGIFYSFEDASPETTGGGPEGTRDGTREGRHGESAVHTHRMVLCDSPAMCLMAGLRGAVPVRERFARVEEEHLWDWRLVEEVRSTRFAATDYNFRTPRAPMDAARSDASPLSPVRGEVFEYPGGYMRLPFGEDHVTPVRLGELTTERATFHGKTNAPALAVGRVFVVDHEPYDDVAASELVVTGLEFDAIGDEFESVSAGDARRADAPVYLGEVRAIRRSEEFRPARVTPKPRVRGPQTAIVVGRPHDEVHTDPHARIKVQFHWDRYGKRDQSSSCWLRVSQAWAGNRYGWLALPRVGHEVIVDFLEGDPDRPIVTGRVYNGDNMPPVSNAGREVAHTPVKRGGGGSGGGAAGAGAQVHAGGGASGSAGGGSGGVGSGGSPRENVAGDGGATSPLVQAKLARTTDAVAGEGDGVGDEAVRGGVAGSPRLGVSARMRDEGGRRGAELGERGKPLFDVKSTAGGQTGPKADAIDGDSDDDGDMPAGVRGNTPMTTFKSDSLNGADGANEITVNDSGSKEGLFFNAQYNEVHVVGNDRIDQVGNNEMVSIGQSRVEDIGQNAQETVGVAKVIDVGTTLLIKAGTSITLQCGASTIHMNQAGVISISGSLLNITGTMMVNMAAPITNVAGALALTQTGMINLTLGAYTLVEGGIKAMCHGAQAEVRASGDCVVKGAKVKLN
jgi:type VI secretion system secreted protein VgrG